MASKQTPPKKLISKKSTFWIAALSISAFLIGNMVGPEGFKGMFATVSNQETITFTGTVNPFPNVVDYSRWAQDGFYSKDAITSQIPAKYFVPMPEYLESEQRKAYSNSKAGDVYSVGYMGSYKTGADGDGAHPGVDIRSPEGNPIVAIANGVVEEVRYSSGFGNTIILKLPNVPSLENDTVNVNYYPLYAHYRRASS
jgi:murein DD-endopeptidase MepM/ murein hydrolase activator NlpD